MKSAIDAILRSDQAAYLEPLYSAGKRALAALGEPDSHGGVDPLLARMEALAAERGYPISDTEVASLLAILARVARPKVIVEVGTNIGYGAIVLARAAGAEARVITIENRADLVAQARRFIGEAGLSNRVEVRYASAITELEAIAGPIDLVYIDCVKEEYGRYLEIVVPKLSSRGIIVADNVMWKGFVASESPPPGENERVGALRAFNLALMTRPELCSVVLPVGDGVGLAVKI